jgi:hypothetical protein
MSIVSTTVVACLAVALLGANLVFLLRPIARPGGAPPADDPGGGSWVRRHCSTLLGVGRGTLNGSVATLAWACRS